MCGRVEIWFQYNLSYVQKIYGKFNHLTVLPTINQYIYIYIYIWPQEGWPSGKDPAHMLYYPLFEPWRVLGMGGGSTHALRLTASSVGVLG